MSHNQIHARVPIRLGVLDVGSSRRSVRLAPRVESLGYLRYWISEHHGEGAIPNPIVLVPAVASLTKRIRVGTAGVLLRFQSALAVAESFSMLARLFPDRIDLGLARADAHAAYAAALRDGRPIEYSAADHAAKVADVQCIVGNRLPPDHPLAGGTMDRVRKVGFPPPLWVHSTSREGATLAARLGAHYSVHDHYSPVEGAEAVRRYVSEFRESPELREPVWSVAVAGYCARDDDDARDARATLYGTVPAGRRVIIGGIDHWRQQLASLVEQYGTGEIIVQTLNGAYDLERQAESFARIADAARGLVGTAARRTQAGDRMARL